MKFVNVVRKKVCIMRETYYWTCPYCKANLDPGESCDCKKETVDDYKSVQGGEDKDVQKTLKE